MKIISSDKTVRSDTIQVLKKFNNQSLTIQAKKGEQLVSMMPAIEKTFNLLGRITPMVESYMVELHTENESSKNKKGSYDKKWLKESKAKLLKQFDNEQRANIIMSTMNKQMNI